ncbi:prepilin peptidase [Thermaurantiacus sp.]
MPDPFAAASDLAPALGLVIAAGAALAASALITVAGTDLLSRRIANRAVLGVALGAIPLVASLAPATALTHFAIAALLFLAGLVPFRAGLIGGGDVKLLAAVGLWAGPDGLALQLLVQALVTLLLVPLLLLAVHVPAGLGRQAAGRARPSVPLGVAIAAGSLAVILSRLGYLEA